MNSINAFFYDGRTSNRQDVILDLSIAKHLRLIGTDIDKTYVLSDLRILPRIGSTPRAIYFPDGSKCEVTEHAAFDIFLNQNRIAQTTQMLHHAEDKTLFAIAAVVLILAIGWATITYVVPEMAKNIAFEISAEADKKLGEDALETLDGFIFSESDLSEERQKQLQTMFSQMTQSLKDGHDYRLEFRSSDALGPNAFALPSGIIILTDDLVELAENDEEIAAVLAHEVGHVVSRHTLRHLLQNTATGLIVAVATGDVFSASATAAALPTMALHAKYSRDFEREADQYAQNYLKQHKIPLKRFSDILQRMQDWHGDDKFPTFISSHPPTEERVTDFKQEK